jgi:serine/threonine protein kinase
VEGESLRIRMRRERPMGIGDAVRMTITIAEALDYAHRQGVVHRDIKPANILLQDGSPIIADFGVAVALDTQDRTRLTRSGILLGSPRYMSPEQLEDARNAAPSSDVYSLACVLHEMIAGEPVFDAGSHPGLAWQHLTQDPPPLRSIRPETPAWLERLVLHALAKAPEARPGSAALLAETLSAGAPTSGSLWRRLGRAAKGLFEGPGSG